MRKTAKPKAPAHLRPATRKWFAHVLDRYDLEEHHLRLLTRAGEMWDRGEESREAIRKHGLTFNDKNGDPKPRPEVVIERQSMILFIRALRELDLDVDPPAEERPRPPQLRRYR